SRVKRRLAATSLIRIICNNTTNFFQHLDHIKRCLRIQLVNKAWYEELNVQGASPALPLGRKTYFLSDRFSAIIFIAVIAASSACHQTDPFHGAHNFLSQKEFLQRPERLSKLFFLRQSVSTYEYTLFQARQLWRRSIPFLSKQYRHPLGECLHCF